MERCGADTIPVIHDDHFVSENVNAGNALPMAGATISVALR
jgi:hypothetical protein